MGLLIWVCKQCWKMTAPTDGMLSECCRAEVIFKGDLEVPGSFKQVKRKVNPAV